MTEAPLICTPEVREVELGDDDEFMILVRPALSPQLALTRREVCRCCIFCEGYV